MRTLAALAWVIAASAVPTAAVAQTAAPTVTKIATGSTSCVGGAVDAESFSLASQVAKSVIPPGRGVQMIQQVMQTLSAQMGQAWEDKSVDTGLMQILDSKTAKFLDDLKPIIQAYLPSMTNAISCAYVREFTKAELSSIRDFARTPAGQRYLERSSSILSDPSVMAVNQEYLVNLKPAMEAFRRDLTEAAVAYLAKKNSSKK